MPRKKYDWGRVWELQSEGKTAYQIHKELNYRLSAVHQILARTDELPDDDEPTIAVVRCKECGLMLPHFDCVSKNIADYVVYGNPLKEIQRSE